MIFLFLFVSCVADIIAMAGHHFYLAGGRWRSFVFIAIRLHCRLATPRGGAPAPSARAWGCRCGLARGQRNRFVNTFSALFQCTCGRELFEIPAGGDQV